jgi:hypothetical protein
LLVCFHVFFKFVEQRRTFMNHNVMRLVVFSLVLALSLNTFAFAAEGDSTGSTAGDLGIGIASFLVSIPYGAAKIVTALLGGIVGGFTYLFSGFNKDAADQVWYTTIPGDYIITPDHLRGKRDIRFTGVPPEHRSPESRTLETRSPEDRSPEDRLPETRAPQNR